MTAEGAKEYEALEAQAASLITLFTSKGYEHVAPSFIQPASLFLDRIGETLRARTYVFTDPNGEELCLRPDLTLPVCRVFLERGAAEGVAKFCYNGPAFRVQEKPDPLRSREFQQAGIEHFGESGHDADLEVLALTIEAVRKGGVKSFTARVGHLGLFKALLNGLNIPPRWREKLGRAFWRHAAFARELAALSRTKGNELPLPPDALTEGGLLNHLDASGVPLVGLRRPAEIVQRLQDKAADAKEPPLASEMVRLIENYFRTRGDVATALRAVEALARQANIDLGDALEDARALFYGLKALAGPAPIVFEADFGRHFEYYTGMVFQIEIDSAGVACQIAGGGRYDGLIHALSRGMHNIPAVGAALHTERLLAAAR
ncbi:MAG: ATP phosphoribosyltransferase regulatory subunit [Rhodomicrobium sp.]